MAVTANSIVTPQTPLAGNALCTSANTNYAVPTAAVALIPTQTNGARITRLFALALATVTATELQIYVSPDGGTTKKFIDSALMSAYTVAQTTKQPKVDFGFSDSAPLLLAAGESLYAAIGVALATGIMFRAEGSSY